METKEKPEVGKAILFAIIGVVAFYILSLILTIPLSFFFSLIVSIPVLRFLFTLFTWLKDSEYVRTITFIASAISISAISWMIKRFCDKHSTEVLSLKVCGIIIAVLNVIFLVINMRENAPIATNIIVGGFGLALFFLSN